MSNQKHRQTNKKSLTQYRFRDFKESYIQVLGQDPSYQASYAHFEKFQEESTDDPELDFFYSSNLNPHDHYLGWPDYQTQSLLHSFFRMDHSLDPIILQGQSASLRPVFQGAEKTSEEVQASLGQRLQAHSRLLGEAYLDTPVLYPALAGYIGNGSDMAKVFAVAETADPETKDAPLWIGVFAPFWLRCPSTYAGESLQGLIRHIFHHEGACMPESMDAIWATPISLEDHTLYHITLYLFLAQQSIPGSIYMDILPSLYRELNESLRNWRSKTFPWV